MGTGGRAGAAGVREGGDAGTGTAGKGIPGENSVSKGWEERWCQALGMNSDTSVCKSGGGGGQ